MYQSKCLIIVFYHEYIRVLQNVFKFSHSVDMYQRVAKTDSLITRTNLNYKCIRKR